MNLILNNLIHYDAIYLYCKNGQQEIYQDLVDKIEMLKETYNITVPFVFKTELKDVVKLEDMNRDLQNIVIFDDFIGESPKTQQEIITPFFVRGRHVNASVYYLSQSYTLTGINVRRNCTYFMFWGASRQRDIGMLYQDHGCETEPKAFKRAFLSATKERYSFFTVDTTNPDKKYRKGLSEILTIGSA